MKLVLPISETNIEKNKHLILSWCSAKFFGKFKNADFNEDRIYILRRMRRAVFNLEVAYWRNNRMSIIAATIRSQNAYKMTSRGRNPRLPDCPGQVESMSGKLNWSTAYPWGKLKKIVI